MKIDSINIQIKAFLNNGKVLAISTYKKRRALNFIQRVKEQKVDKYHLRVSYGKRLNNQNQHVSFINEGEYKNESDLIKALKVFLEK